MAAYLIAHLRNVSDQAGLAEYGQSVGATMAPYGAKRLAGGPGMPGEQIEGDGPLLATFLVEFPSIDALKEWYDSEGYREPKALRLRSADFEIVFINGAEPS